ncbi:MAG TPA: VWA domain-containing protein [Pyrinomonadaceae bacterium]|nr:VWA domain-containing protein [Pyrinomonadaceae bacterium]
MKVHRSFEKVLIFGLVCVCSCTTVSAQESGSSASVSRTRAIGNANPNAPHTPSTTTYYPTSPSHPIYSSPAPVFRIPDEVAVEEFVNYHKHRLPLPKSGQAVAMDTRWGNAEYSRFQREAVLQIGFTTAEVNERTDLRPLNLVLVIDKSGSMADSDKMSRVKESLRTMLDKLRPEDILSIVTFDTTAQVLYSAGRIGDGHGLRRAIDCIEPGGATNIHSGLMLGYAEAKKHFRKDSTNRVILLTDGIANQGVVDPDRIAADSSECNGQGIDLSTIGVGLDLNNDLLRTLAKSGRGLYHFISDYKDINKVFVTEVQSLISSVAKRVEVRIEYGPGLHLDRIYGYSPRYGNGTVSVGLDDMNNGLTQVVMAKFRTQSAKNVIPVKVRLSYFDVRRKCMVEEIQEARLVPAESDSCDLLADVEVKKNYTIAELANSLFEMTGLARFGNHTKAQNVLDASVAIAYRRYPNMEDEDIRFILNIVEGYRRDLTAYNAHYRRSDCGSCR